MRRSTDSREAMKNCADGRAKEGRAALLRCGEVCAVSRVSGPSNEMFSDFRAHVIGVPQIAPLSGNVTFDGPGSDEDFGLEQVTGNPDDRYKFRTSPIRNVGLQPAFFHNGAFTTLEDAVRHHLDVFASARTTIRPPPGSRPICGHWWVRSEPVLARLDPLLATPIDLTSEQFRDLVDFVRHGLLDRRARPEHLRKLIPRSVPSGFPVLDFP